MTIYPRKHGWFEHPPREYTVFSRVKRDSRSPYFDQTCRFTPVLQYKMSKPKTYLDMEREARIIFLQTVADARISWS